ncbi:MAG: helix-turn-helix transcriptional regulator [Blastocatellia bacterium]
MAKENKPRNLTDREKEVVKLLADGYANEEVGTILGLSRRTIEAHRARVMLKLNIHTLPGLVKYCIQNEITTLDTHRSDPRLADE